MKLPLIIAVALAGLVSMSVAAAEPESLTVATAATIVSQLVTNPPPAPVTITESNTVVALAGAIQTAPGKWKRGSFTAPAGYVRFAFLRDSQVLAVIALGDRFLVRGSGGHWEYKDITKELEARIAAFGQQKLPQGGANGRQPSGSETNRTSAAAASRRSP